MVILGISAYYHDAAATIIVNDEIVAAAQEERFTRKKHDSEFPLNAIHYCLAEANCNINDIDYVVFYDKPFLKFERLFETYLAFAPKGFKSFATSLPVWVKDKLFQKSALIEALVENLGSSRDFWKDKLLFSEHHLSHAASAFFPSPFEEAAVLSMDGVGEWATTSLAIGHSNKLEMQQEIHFPHSIGLLYSALTYYLGFKVNSGEYKVMGLAPYGVPKYTSLIKDNLIDIKDDGSFHLDMSYFDFCTDLKMTNNKFNRLFGGQPRKPESLLTQKDMDIAASIQLVIEEIVLKLARGIKKNTGLKNLCLSGGVALNCVANGKLLKENIFDNLWIQPASGDAGGSLGAALAVNYLKLKRKRSIASNDSMKGSFLGPSFHQQDIEKRLSTLGASYTSLSQEEMLDITAKALADGYAIGWHQGRMEFGPRSLGGRSILADPRSPKIQKQLNLKVKYRESFRPFAPSILDNYVSEWFDLKKDDISPYMLLVANVTNKKQILMTEDEKKLFGIEKLNIPRSEIPAVTHVDYSARIQTVHKDTNPVFYSLLNKFYELTKCPVLVNTSFNVRGEPIVCTPEDSFNCLMGTGLDLLIVGNCILWKKDQDKSLIKNYENEYELD
jgi:carbamoyltransferase